MALPIALADLADAFARLLAVWLSMSPEAVLHFDYGVLIQTLAEDEGTGQPRCTDPISGP